MGLTKITEYNLKTTDQFFFDTNIWLLMFGTVANYQKNHQKVYSNFLNELIRRDIPIYINSLIISEFTNVLLRIDFKEWVKNNNLIDKEFKKDFVGNNEYKKSVAIINNLINSILKLPNIVKSSDNFNSIDFNNISKNIEVIDFNDSFYLELARLSNYKIVTNDKDYQKVTSNVDILTNLI